MTLKTGTVLILAAFAVTLAYQLVDRLSSDALNVAIGVLFGIAASVPVSLGLLIALTRERAHARQDELRDEPAPAPTYVAPRLPQAPQIIVLAPPQSPYAQGNGYAPPGGAAFPSYWQGQTNEVLDTRDWRIIGEDA